MKVTMVNKKLRIGSVAIQSASSASLIQFGDADVITASSLTDTPADSLIMQPLDQQTVKPTNPAPSEIVNDRVKRSST